MSKKIINKSTYSQAIECVAAILSSRKVDLNIKHIVIVPDKYTLMMEKVICKASGATFDVEVMTFNRLFAKTCTCNNYINKQAALLHLQKAVIKREKSLKFFGRSIRWRGFYERIYEIIALLQSNKITPEMLRVNVASMQHKLDDIRTIFEGYNEEIRGKWVDSNGRMNLLEEAIRNSSYFDNTHVYIVNFDTLTTQAQSLISALESRVISLTLTGLSGDSSTLDEGWAKCLMDNMNELAPIFAR